MVPANGVSSALARSGYLGERCMSVAVSRCSGQAWWGSTCGYVTWALKAGGVFNAKRSDKQKGHAFLPGPAMEESSYKLYRYAVSVVDLAPDTRRPPAPTLCMGSQCRRQEVCAQPQRDCCLHRRSLWLNRDQ